MNWFVTIPLHTCTLRLTTVRSGAEERTFRGARLDIPIFRQRSCQVIISYSAECSWLNFSQNADVFWSGWDVLVISGWTFFGHAFFDIRFYCICPGRAPPPLLPKLTLPFDRRFGNTRHRFSTEQNHLSYQKLHLRKRLVVLMQQMPI